MVDEDGENALSEAIRQGDETVVAELLGLYVDLEWETPVGRVSALQVACQCFCYVRSISMLQTLLERSPKGFDIEDDRGVGWLIA